MQSLHDIGQTPYQKAPSGRPSLARPKPTPLDLVKFLATVLLDVLTFFVLLVPLTVGAIVRLVRRAPKKNISGWTALVTGGANGLGRDICLQLAQAGCHIAVVDLDANGGEQTVADIRKLGVKAQFFKADVSSYQAVRDMKKEVNLKLGPVDILVNNAGVLPLMSLREGTPDDLKKVIEINLLSHLWTLRLFTDDMIERKRGHIVAIASVASYLPIERMIAYAASKYGVRGLMGAFASELYTDGVDDLVKTTTVYPSFIKTRAELMDALKQFGSPSSPKASPEEEGSIAMEVAWRFRIIFVMAFVVIIFGDLLGYGGARKEPKGKSLLSGITEVEANTGDLGPTGKDAASAGTQTRTGHTNAIGGSVESDFEEEENTAGLSSAELAARKEKLKNSLREACLPKLLCEMAAKPNYSLNVRERDLLSLIRSTTLSLTMAVSPTKWHFAAHMGQLLRDAGDTLVTPIGCSHLWPSCPYSSKKLLKLTNVVHLK
uniref:Ketoreductase domain-containing protein n=2 Tax=Anopheles atroparvus TaxID=41427 RepID=A0A182JBQ0_ANOAO